MTDNRTVIKVKLKNILRNDIDYTNLYNSINRANNIRNIGYLFIRSFILYTIENTKYDLDINIEFIRRAFSVLTTKEGTKKGRPFNNTTKTKIDIIQLLRQYFNIFSLEANIQIIDASNLSYILEQSYSQLLISIKNNIKYHFDKHVWKFIKVSFNDKLITIKDKNDSNELTKFYSELDNINSDLLNNTSKSNEKEWINKYKKLIIPNNYSNSMSSITSNNIFSYLKCMLYMNKFIQTKECKSYQIFPIRSSCYNNYIKINTSALIDIFITNKKLTYFSNAGDNNIQEQLWNNFFKLKNNKSYIYKRKDYSFNYELDTDGYGVSLNFIHNNDKINKETKKSNFKKARIKTAKQKLLKTKEEYTKYIDDKLKLKEKEEYNMQIVKKQKITNLKEKYKKMTDIEKEEVQQQLNDKSNFPYIDKLLKNNDFKVKFQKDFNDGKILVCDPGKNSILYLMACNKKVHIKTKEMKHNNFGVSVWNNHKIMNYTNKTRIKLTKRLKYGELIEKWKSETNNKQELTILKRTINRIKNKKCNKQSDKNVLNLLKMELKYKEKTLKEIETELGTLNSKSCNHKEFINFVIKKLEHFKKSKNEYNTEYLQKLKWYSYLNRRRHEDELLNQIENEFGKDITIIMGDYSGKGNLKVISTPNIGIKQKLKERFKVYHIDEYLTSKIHYKHHIRCENMKIKTEKESKIRLTKLHSVLSYKLDKLEMECNKSEMGCINRDKNSVLNMETIINELLKSGKRPKIFSRQKKSIISTLNLNKDKLNDAVEAHIGSN